MIAAELPRIALLTGDPAGIGPELLAKLLADSEASGSARLALIGDPAVLAQGAAVARVALPGIPVLAEVKMPEAGWEPGSMSRACGAYVLDSLAAAAEAVRQGRVDGIVFAPFNKGAMRLAGLEHEDELRLLQSLLDVSGFVCEFNVTGALWTSRVTSHIPLKDVAASISIDGVRDAVRIIDRSLREAGLASPRIGVAALNPHAGDGGTMGREEIDLIAPAVASLRAEGIDARGPMPADTIFVAARRGDYDAVVSMYHDQGQIAMKLMGFDSGVTVLGGLPVPFTTCASGTAFDIVGKGIANVEGLRQALAINVRMAASRHGPGRTAG
ncbi:4-hydroxythreonine-4-phosphate dehydrogenase PdxA [Burkholderiaceae bacterium FT117]|uniref:4-hydroxythreonine-4-phosphate dehydrogenase PdxA n=1 Tax=Zeimonas sediminis TaxID=2944268 RepID=UPI002342E28A|nr:4-hydroxythreonine-4-phosphate dehydrogenase PdxA [Zeimonas sediminis]MCM5569697.1 4-hydroxythreonine-4-phosphate dehydrogenase PdxA [Zeimonas sediminis]